MGKAGLLDPGQNLVNPADIYRSAGKRVAAADDLVSADFHQRDGLGVAGLEPDGRARSNIQTVAVRFGAVKMELRVCLDEMIVRPNLVCYLFFYPDDMISVE